MCGDKYWTQQKWFSLIHVFVENLPRSLQEPGGPCTMSMEVSESRMERVNKDWNVKHRISRFSQNNNYIMPFKIIIFIA